MIKWLEISEAVGLISPENKEELDRLRAIYPPLPPDDAVADDAVADDPSQM